MKSRNRYKIASLLVVMVVGLAIAVSLAAIGSAGGSNHNASNWTDFAVHNMGAPLNTVDDEGEMTYAADGTMVYCSARKDLALTPNGTHKELYIATFNKEKGTWNTPVNMGIPINHLPGPEPLNKGDDREPYINAAGDTIWFKSDRSATSSPVNANDIYVTHKVGGVWQTPELIGAPISTDQGNEHCPQVTRDEKTMYVTSQRPGGYGGYDIWVSTKDNAGNWQTPVNAGPNINSASTEYHNLLNRSENKLIVSSNRPGGYGLMDMYVHKKSDDQPGGWGPAVNLGPAINTAASDACPAFTRDYATFSWFSGRTDNSLGKVDMFWTKSTNLPRPGDDNSDG